MRRIFAILLGALLCCGFVPQHKASHQKGGQKPISELYTEAIKFATIQHDTIAAVVAIEAIFKQDPNHAPALSLLSRLTRVRENAAKYAERAYLADTTNRFYLEAYGEALIQNGEYDKAIPIFKKIVDKSTEPDHYRLLALLLDEKGRTAEALAVIDTIDTRFGRIPALGRIRQFFLLKTGQTLSAVADAQRCVEEAPYIAENHTALGRVYAMVRRDSLAVSSFKRAIAIDSLNIEPWVALGDFYKERGNTEQSLIITNRLFASNKISLKHKIEEWNRLSADRANYRKHYMLYDQLIKRLYISHPESREVTNLYIRHLILSGNIAQALALQKQLISAASKVEDYMEIIEMESYLNHTDSVVHYTNLAARLFPKNRELLQMQGYLAAHNKEYDRALAINKELLKGAENDTVRSTLWGAIGDIEHQRNKTKQSYKAYDKSLRYYSDNAGILNNYAYYLSLEERDLERALTMITRALDLSKNNPTYLDTMAWVLYKLGRYAEAKRYMQQALSLDRSKSPEFPLHYGDILHALGEEFMAKTYWRKALERGADVKEIEKRFMPESNKPPKE